MKAKQLAILNVVTYIAMILMNSLAIVYKINGMSVSEVSNRNSNILTPAGFTFSIWSVIYLGLLILVIYLVMEAGEVTRLIGYPLLMTSIINGTWIVVWQYEWIAFSFVLTLILVIMLAIIFRRLHCYIKYHEDRKNRYFVYLPITIYFAWSCVACIENFAVLMVSKQSMGFGINQYIWGIFAVLLILILTLMLVQRTYAYAFSLTIMFALFGIYSNLENRTSLFAYFILLVIGALCLQIIYCIICHLKMRYRKKQLI